MHERPNTHSEHQRPLDLLGITWPTAPLPQEILSLVIEGSKTHPLREIIAALIANEAKELWEQVKFKFDTDPKNKSDQEIAISGYGKVAGVMQYVCMLYNDRQGAVAYHVNAYKALEGIFGVEPSEIIDENLPRDTEKEMQDTVLSLIIDPTGMDLLRRKLRIREAVWNGSCTGTTKYNGDDPEVIGFRNGVVRFKKFYEQAVSVGATPDKGSNILKSKILRIRREITEHPLFELAVDIFRT